MENSIQTLEYTPNGDLATVHEGNCAGLQELWYSSSHKNNLDLRDLKSSEWSNIVRPGQNYLWHFLLAIWKTNGGIWTGKGKVNGVKDASHFWDNCKTGFKLTYFIKLIFSEFLMAGTYSNLCKSLFLKYSQSAILWYLAKYFIIQIYEFCYVLQLCVDSQCITLHS